MSQHRDVPVPTTITTTTVSTGTGTDAARSVPAVLDTSAPPSPPAPASTSRGLRLGAILAVSCVAQFMIVLDSTIVTVALPSMRASLRLSAEQQQWIVDGYLVALGGLLLFAARLGDVAGHRRVFRAGLVVFTLASLAGGLASDGTLLVAARAVQGMGAAALAPSSLSLIATTHTEAARRTKALARWSLMGGAAGAVGVVLGGILTAELDWRWVLFVNVPIGAALFVAAGLVLPRSPRRGGADGPRLDLPGALLATLAASILTFGFSRAPVDGWASTQVLSSLIAAPVLAALFVVAETRSATPLVPPSFFRSRRLSVGNAMMFCLGATMTAALVLITLYLQQCLGYSALRSGLALVPMTIVLVVGTLLSRPLLPILGSRTLLAGGGLVAAAGLVWMSELPTHSAYPLHVLGPTAVTGLGISSMLLGVTVAATSGVHPRNAGSASGLLTTSRQLGGALGLAALTSVADFATRSAGTAGPVAAAVHGYHVAILWNAGIMVLAAIAAVALPRDSVVRSSS
jgi:EmrB/QacA subfamily drug resistance transporter